MALKGLKRVRANGHKLLTDGIEQRAKRAAYVATSIIAGHASLMTPVDTSNLINSQYTRVVKAGTRINGYIGYTARYAYWVHESPGTLMGQPRAHFGKTKAGVAFGGGTLKGNYWAPNGKPKFLTRAGDDNKSEIDRAVHKAMKI